VELVAAAHEARGGAVVGGGARSSKRRGASAQATHRQIEHDRSRRRESRRGCA
jgi:hypothetical protein